MQMPIDLASFVIKVIGTLREKDNKLLGKVEIALNSNGIVRLMRAILHLLITIYASHPPIITST